MALRAFQFIFVNARIPSRALFIDIVPRRVARELVARDDHSALAHLELRAAAATTESRVAPAARGASCTEQCRPRTRGADRKLPRRNGDHLLATPHRTAR
jgi:hypothetical protein